jgi:hypothetical protein
MPECPKCGYRVREDMIFCPNCGASLKTEQTSTPTRPEPPIRYTREKEEKYENREKREKGEKSEKGETHEKGEFGFIGPLIGGLILIFLGLAFYLERTGVIAAPYLWAFFLVVIGAIIILAAIYGSIMAHRRYPRT